MKRENKRRENETEERRLYSRKRRIAASHVFATNLPFDRPLAFTFDNGEGRYFSFVKDFIIVRPVSLVERTKCPVTAQYCRNSRERCSSVVFKIVIASGSRKGSIGCSIGVDRSSQCR